MADENVKEMKKVEGTEAEQAKGDKRDKVGQGHLEPPTSEVEGQIRQWARVRCPWPDCRTIQWIIEDTEVYLWFECCNCGRLFKY